MNPLELTAAIQAGRAELEAALQGLTDDQLRMPGAAGAWSVKDILAHLTACEVDLLTNLGRSRRGQKPGKQVWTQAEIDAQNAQWYADYRDRPLERVLDDFRGVHRQILRLVEGLSDRDLAAPLQWRRGQTLHDFIVEYVVDHEAEHLPELRAWRQKQMHAANGAE
jgi:uncharacterized damage-inducible protein DinB